MRLAALYTLLTSPAALSHPIGIVNESRERERERVNNAGLCNWGPGTHTDDAVSMANCEKGQLIAILVHIYCACSTRAWQQDFTYTHSVCAPAHWVARRAYRNAFNDVTIAAKQASKLARLSKTSHSRPLYVIYTALPEASTPVCCSVSPSAVYSFFS